MGTLLILIGVVVGMLALLLIIKFMVSPDPRLIQLNDDEYSYKGYVIRKAYTYKEQRDMGKFDLKIKIYGREVKFMEWAYMYEAMEWINSRGISMRIKKFFWS